MKPRLWAGLAPFGIGRTKPHHYLEMARAAWDNRHAPLYAWRILSRGVCDGCTLGVTGFRDWTKSDAPPPRRARVPSCWPRC